MNKSDDPIELTRNELYNRVWSTPMVKLAREFGISNVALAKRCKKHNVPVPYPGYWSLLKARQMPLQTPLPRADPAEPTRIIFRRVKSSARQQTEVQETVDFPAEGDELHPLAAHLRNRLEAVEVNEDGLIDLDECGVPRTSVSAQLIVKTCRAFHALMIPLEEAGVWVSQTESRKPGGSFEKDEECLQICISEPLDKESYRPSGRLRFRLQAGRCRLSGRYRWDEGPRQTLERIVPAVASRVVEALGEMIHERRERERVRKAREEEERLIQHEQRIEEHNEKVRSNLARAASWWAQSECIQRYVSATEALWNDNQSGNLTEGQKRWLGLARNEAARISPSSFGYPDPIADAPASSERVPIGGSLPDITSLPALPTERQDDDESASDGWTTGSHHGCNSSSFWAGMNK